MCETGCLENGLVKRKIVLYDSFDGINEAFTAGAIGCITNLPYNDDSFVVPFPASVLNPTDYNSILSYLNSRKYVFLVVPFSLINFSHWPNNNCEARMLFSSINNVAPSLLFAEILAQRY